MKKTAFTLIELMVVVAVIAILATLSVTSFSAAIKRTRNAGRQADIEAVAKALETCYDVSSGRYTGFEKIPNELQTVTMDSPAGPFLKSINPCLNESLAPKMGDYDYYYITKTSVPQAFLICAKLEKVANWGSVGNANSYVSTIPDDGIINLEPCTEEGGVCYFCAKNQQ